MALLGISVVLIVLSGVVTLLLFRSKSYFLKTI